MFLVPACTVSGQAFSIHDGPYKAVWSKNSDQLARDDVPYRPTATTPGVCNIGGDAQRCASTDIAVTRDLRVFLTDLQTTSVPPQYRRASAAFVKAVQLEIKGLHQRVASLQTGGTSELLRTSNMTLAAAHEAVQSAYAMFPAVDRPTPTPEL
jgi:hypothetical protein